MSGTHVDPDYTHIRNAMLESIESQRQMFLERLKLQEEQEKETITSRLTLFESTERDRLLLEREQILSETMLKKEADLQNEYALKRKQVNLEHSIFREEKMATIQFDIETEKRRLLQHVEDQHQHQLSNFRVKLSEDYAKIQSSIKEQHEWEIVQMNIQHDKTAKEEIAILSKKLEEENNAQIALFKDKLEDERNRLRVVEKLFLKTELEEEANHKRDILKKEYDDLAAILEKEYNEKKQLFADLHQEIESAYNTHKKMYAEMLESEKIFMEKERITANASEIERFEKELEDTCVRMRAESEQLFVKETETRRAELLRLAEEDIAQYKIAKRKEISDEISFIRDRELEEMRASLYTLAMEQIEKKVVDKLSSSRI